MTVQYTGETTRIVKVTFHKKKTEILRKKPFAGTESETRILRNNDPWKFGR